MNLLMEIVVVIHVVPIAFEMKWNEMSNVQKPHILVNLTFPETIFL